MYFFSVFMMVHHEAGKFNIAGEKSETGTKDTLPRGMVLRAATGGDHDPDAVGFYPGLLGGTRDRDLQSHEGYISNELLAELSSRKLDDARQILLGRRLDDFAIKNIERFCQERLADQPKLSYDIKIETGERLEKILEQAHGGGYDLLITSKHGNRIGKGCGHGRYDPARHSPLSQRQASQRGNLVKMASPGS